jgi:hypothetical protein
MNTYRNTVSSVLVAAMSVYACLLLADTPAHALQAAAVSKSQADAQSKKSALINKRPLTDLVRRVFSLHERGEVNLDTPFEILIEGNRNSEGLIYNVEITQNSGDPTLRQIAEEFVAALNESNALYFLDEAKHLRLKIDSSETNMAATVSYATESTKQARNKAKGYGALLFMGAQVKKGQAEELIYKSISVSSEDREVIVNFSMPRETFCALLSKYLSSN